MARKQEKTVFVGKQPGETPLEALERYRATRPELEGVPMTYAGRLDPMAEGTLLVLLGDECKNKGRYLKLDKEYEMQAVFGITTDTYDALGLAEAVSPLKASDEMAMKNLGLSKYARRSSQEYPPYSSKTVDGIQLHELARAGELPDEMPVKEVQIYSIEKTGEHIVTAADLKKSILSRIDMVRGDFRQEEIKKRWDEALADGTAVFYAIRIKVKCSSGTYMRSLAHRMGKDAGMGAFALTIKRTKIVTERH